MQSKRTMVLWFLVVSGLSFAWVAPAESVLLYESVSFDASVSDEPNDDADLWCVAWPELLSFKLVVSKNFYEAVLYNIPSGRTIRGPPVV